MSVPDLDASVKWYQDVLGFTKAYQIDMGPEAGSFVMMRTGDFYIELFGIPKSKPSADVQTASGQDLSLHGTKHIAFMVADIKQMIEYFKIKKIEFTVAGPPDKKDDPQAIFIRDNSGIPLEFVANR